MPEMRKAHQNKPGSHLSIHHAYIESRDMKHALLFLFCLLSFKVSCQPTNNNFGSSTDAVLVPISRNHRWGFINNSGEEVIPTKFRRVEYFSESLAAACTDGLWGFINLKGEYVIPPVYDFVGPFKDGKAVVWKNGIPAFVDSTGKQIFEIQGGRYTMRERREDRQVCTFIRPDTKESRYFVLRLNGDIDPFESLLKQPENLTIITQNKGYETLWAVQDSSGNLIVPFGTYDHIDPFQKGFAEVAVNQYGIGIIDEKGRLILQLPPGIRLKNVENPGSPDSLAIVDLNLMDERFSLLRGKLMAFYSDSLKRSSMTPEQFCELCKLSEVYLYAIANAHGHIISEKFNAVHPKGFQPEGLLVQIWETPTPEHLGSTFKPVREQWGLLDRSGKWIISPRFTRVGPEGFRNGLLYAEMDSLCGYVNPNGKFVWSTQKKFPPRAPQQLNVDYMIPASYYVYSDRKTLSSDTTHKRFTGNEMGIVIQPDEPALFKTKYQGMTAYLYNTQKDSVLIDVQDGQLYMVLQALDMLGEWKDIEYVYPSSCGNSYFQRSMPPNEYWTFQIPVYDGDFSTTLRLAFSPNDRFDATHRIYSNVITGKINRTQLWRQRQDLYLMDVCSE